jgi:hypothetical protein
MRNDAHVVEFRTHVDSIIRPAENLDGTITGRHSHIRDCRCMAALIFSTSYSGTSLWIARGVSHQAIQVLLGDYIDRGRCIPKGTWTVSSNAARTQMAIMRPSCSNFWTTRRSLGEWRGFGVWKYFLHISSSPFSIPLPPSR